MADQLVNLTIDGQAVSAPKGTNLIEAARAVGIEIPHYCYHPKLTIAGNCRMCLVDVGLPALDKNRQPELDGDGNPVIRFAPKLSIGCNTPVGEGMVVHTSSEKVVNAREGVMEFLLVNHPLDCPICDQAGECRLQEFSVDYGQGESRFIEPKVNKPKKSPIGPKITLDDERCILCSRCIRFMDEVAGQDCLGFVERGSYSTLTCYPGQEPNTNYDLNIVDLCPVGALTANDFRFQQRVWFLKETKSVCPSCATGCNTVLWSREGVVYRQTPRDNEDVNQCWMCDHGRLNYQFINDPNRLTAPSVKSEVLGQRFNLTWTDVTRQLAARLREAIDRGGASIAAVGTACATTEELFLFRKLAGDVLGAGLIDSVPRQETGDEFLLSADRNPNAAGARLAGVEADPPGSRLAEIVAGIESGTITTLIVHGENLAQHGLDSALLDKLELLVVIDTLPNPVTEAADFLLPGATFAEKRGTFINRQNRLQRLNQAIPSPGIARPEWQTLAALLRELGDPAEYLTIEDVFADMARALPGFAGLNLSKIGDAGVVIGERRSGTASGSGAAAETPSDVAPDSSVVEKQ